MTSTRHSERSAPARSTPLVALLATLLWPSVASAVVTSDEPGSHVVSAGETVYGLNLDGVASLALAMLGGDGELVRDPFPICTGSLVSDRHVITAAHCFDVETETCEPGSDGQVDPFFRLASYAAIFDLEEGRVAIPMDLDNVRFAPGWPYATADVAVVELAEPAPASLPRYPLYGGTNEIGKQVVVTGYGAPGHGPNGIDSVFELTTRTKRAGLNRIEHIARGGSGMVTEENAVEFLTYDFDSGLNENNSLSLTGISSDLGYGIDEVISVIGDSGGPVFIDGAIAGIFSHYLSPLHGDMNEQVDGSWGELAWNVRVSSLREFAVNATEGTAEFVLDHLPGDYNNNGTVEQADLDLVLLNWGEDAAYIPDGWMSNLPTGTIDQAELDGVLLNWGNSSAIAATNVPEPSTLALLLITLVVSSPRIKRMETG